MMYRFLFHFSNKINLIVMRINEIFFACIKQNPWYIKIIIHDYIHLISDYCKNFIKIKFFSAKLYIIFMALKMGIYIYIYIYTPFFKKYPFYHLILG